ncbi:unnamed protein product [Mesocestoides corti]|uniref:Glycosyltransferase family 92 protein n=1 Tax=Mesocestoides corti TaxID=53468 RepID=A0A0R3UJP3_MESCO|nr:unnamed protein product [Mesocestoides corti]
MLLLIAQMCKQQKQSQIICVVTVFLIIYLLHSHSNGRGHSAIQPARSMEGVRTGLQQIGSVANLAVYSVFLDRRMSDNQTEHRALNGHINGVLRIILVKKREFRPRLRCIFPDKTEVPSRDLRGSDFHFYELTENHQRPYGGYTVHCDVPPDAQLHGLVVISMDEPDRGATPPHSSHFRYRFAVCVPALHHLANFNLAFLGDWFEVHIRLGVTKFRIYYSEVLSGALKSLFFSLQNRVEVDLIPFFWPGNDQAISRDSWYYLQTTTVNDCLLRSLYDTEYVFFGDLDEILVPHQAGIVDWDGLVQAVWKDTRVPGICFPTHEFHTAPSKSFSLAANILRTAQMDPFRTKCLVQPTAIFEMGIHHISKPYEEASLRIQPKLNITQYAFIHHYKKFPPKATEYYSLKHHLMVNVKFKNRFCLNE